MQPADMPARLYKYRTFDSVSLGLLCEGESWYAKPTTFNDPLECLPDLSDDVDITELVSLHDHFHGERGQRMRNSYRYGWDEDDGEYEVALPHWRNMLVRDIASRLAKMLDTRGVLTLSQRWDSPLMWSHYADSHRGFCIEYDATDHRCMNLDRVQYDCDRGIELSAVYSWLIRRDQGGLERFVESAFYRKARDWEYEMEWRDVSACNGLHSAPFEVSSIVFGMRCPPQVRTAIMLTYAGAGRQTSPSFYEAFFKPRSFEMGRAVLTPAEHAYIRPSASMALGTQLEIRQMPFGVDDKFESDSF